MKLSFAGPSLGEVLYISKSSIGRLWKETLRPSEDLGGVGVGLKRSGLARGRVERRTAPWGFVSSYRRIIGNAESLTAIIVQLDPGKIITKYMGIGIISVVVPTLSRVLTPTASVRIRSSTIALFIWWWSIIAINLLL